MNQEILSQYDLQAIIESVLFTLARPVSLQELGSVFQNEKIPAIQIREALSSLDKKYQSEKSCGIELHEVAGAYQLRTKEENKNYIRRLVKGRLFKLSASALEVLVIVAYQQPCKKMSIDNIRGVESGHLLKTLMEKNLICFGSKSSDPGHYITYKTTPQFLEVFGIKHLKDLPAAEDIKDLLSSETDLDQEGEGMETVLKDLHISDTFDSKSQQVISDELEKVSQEISSVKLKKQAIKEQQN